MTESTSPAPAGKATKAKMAPWLFWTIFGVAAAVFVVLVYLVASVTVPLMWATAIRDQVAGKLGNAIPIGMFYGFVFTFAPITIAWQARRRSLNKWVRVGLLVLGVLLLIPNLLTLGVMYGSSATAADARAIWATGANWFGTWSQIFMVVGVVCAVASIVLVRMWLSRGRALRAVKAAEKQEREAVRVQERADKDAARAAEKAARAAAKDNRNGPGAGNPAEPPQA
ncbi:heme/copper-type cytochrome/quinol oxidase subunit 2 [Arthrobacter stackebrandtii]|uniref:Heme/copper-type cytochrome/quinol oxidase subunit 2 n=1 Tax=Arthrobacter stackebrandtii TaxID=272161 RepID=A0ABS4Z208_9MICC|nr:hypothetical protein [Arthrobacter stackebrandtii]MBP2415009.1 heme/copper-type cytochrome/quinol oxidase subunit 2 [Arthrobacter stackebrandtii]PYH00838.1 hypothetical protein CVV67_07720 [Arthrobacter stackebrandtii]